MSNHLKGETRQLQNIDADDITAVQLPELSSQQLDSLDNLLSGAGLQFPLSSYKDSCIKRRIALRIRACGVEDADSYLNLLSLDQVECEKLVRTLTIHVSHFFRNPGVFELLKKEILPALFQGKADGERLNIWSLGCAKGEEPYSLALLLLSDFPEQFEKMVSLLATDIDLQVLEQAREGFYDPAALKELTLAQTEAGFTYASGRYKVRQELSQSVEFRQMDITQVEEYPATDLVLCRNTLIYFNRTAQEKILHGLADILSDNGILVLGKSETLVGSARRRFSVVCPVERVYRKRQ
jgi:chemotaxis protein methyltransferase CheR